MPLPVFLVLRYKLLLYVDHVPMHVDHVPMHVVYLR